MENNLYMDIFYNIHVDLSTSSFGFDTIFMSPVSPVVRIFDKSSTSTQKAL